MIKIILKYFQLLNRWKNYIALFAVSMENLKNLLEKILVLSTIFSKCKNEDKNYLKKKNQLGY